MIIEQHYDEEVLIGLLEEEHPADPHVPACDTCAGTLASYRDLTAALQDGTVWEARELSEVPAPQTANMLRSFAATTATEDAAAGAIVDKLIAATSEQRTALLERNPQWRTAGVVRRVLKAVDKTNFTDPKVAAELAGLGVEIAESIDPAPYPLDTVVKLRATAWRELAYALHYIGSFPEAISALDRADESLRDCVVSDYDAARLKVLRAQVYGETEQLEEAIVLADSAGDVFHRFGDVPREAAAQTTKAGLLMHARRFTEALTMHRQIAADARGSASSRAFALHNMAICHRELSQFKQAEDLFAQTVDEFRRLGLVSERAKARWSLSKVLMAEQRYEQAWPLVLEVRQEFEELGMAQDVALVSLDMAEALLMTDRPAEVVDLCQVAMDYFSKAGLAYTQGALTALAYVKEAAKSRTLTPGSLQGVRTFFELLPKQPNLLFAYPA